MTIADHPAVEDGNRVVTYGAFNGQVDAHAANLQTAKIAPGDLVAVMLPSSAEHLVILCALARTGGVVFSLAPSLRAGEFRMAIAGLGVTAVIASARRAPVSGLKNFTVEEICRPAPQPCAAPTVDDDDPYLLIQSLGTTGEPKSFFRSHGDAKECIRRYAQNYQLTANDRTMSLVAMPFNVGRNVCLGTLRVGATIVVHRVSPIGDLVATMAGRRVTFLLVAPVQARQLLSGSDNEAPLFPGLRIMTVGSAPFTRHERGLARRRLSPNLHEQPGTNETGDLTIATPADQDAYPDAVGRLIEGIEAQIVDTNHRPLPPGEVGIARFRGPDFTTGYLDNPDATAWAFRDGWYYSGDRAALNDEGYLFLQGPGR
ncbi:MAG: AMP-binding protein [Alphaproteobacteria bacterium]